MKMMTWSSLLDGKSQSKRKGIAHFLYRCSAERSGLGISSFARGLYGTGMDQSCSEPIVLPEDHNDLERGLKGFYLLMEKLIYKRPFI